MGEKELEAHYRAQLKEFDLARKNYENFQKAVFRTVKFEGFKIGIQHNPDRIISTNAKTDAYTLNTRPCFLCRDHLPIGQKGLSYNEKYDIQINPYPIFTRHFTVPAKTHIPQFIQGRFEDLLSIAFDFPAYTVFYNGPKSGASAPDHFHFQMAPRNVMPAEHEVTEEELREVLVQGDYYSVFTLKNYLRRILVLQASDLKLLSGLFEQTLAILKSVQQTSEEPLFNIHCWFDNCQWTVCLFLRRQLRPWQFFAEGNEKILFSAGAVDMAGIIIAPRSEDFQKYTPELITDLYRQVSIDDNLWNRCVQPFSNLKP